MSAPRVGVGRIDGRPTAGVTVYVIDTEADVGSPVVTLTTDAQGRYTLPADLPPGRYLISTEYEHEGNWYTKTANPRVIVAAPVTDVATVTIAPNDPTVAMGASLSLSATVRNASNQVLSGRSLSWASLSQSIVSITSGGVITALAVGTAVIRVTCEGVVDTITVTVPFVAIPTSIVVSPSSVALTLDPTLRPTTISVVPSSVSLTLEPEVLAPTTITVSPTSVSLTLDDEPETLVPTTIDVSPASVELTLES